MAKLTFKSFLKNPALLEKATKEELAEAYNKIKYFSEEIEGAKKAINLELWNKMSSNSDLIKDSDGNRYIATKVSSEKFSTKLQDAEKLGATKTKVVVDTERLKALVESGIEVPGRNVIKYVLVKEVDEKE